MEENPRIGVAEKGRGMQESETLVWKVSTDQQSERNTIMNFYTATSEMQESEI